MKFNIATVQYPTNFEAFLKIIRESAEQEGDKLLGYVVVPGPGCYNHGLMVEGPNAEKLAEQLALVLQPAKYCQTSDDDPAVVEGQFECCERWKRD